MVRSLNRVTLIGNLTRDPEMRYTPQGTAVCTFSVATNRQWKTESGEMRDEAEFHRIVAWDKLAEICVSMLKKGKRVFVEGRIQTRKWQGQDGQQRTTTEIVISDMLALDRLGAAGAEEHSTEDAIQVPDDFGESANQDPFDEGTKESVKPKKVKAAVEKTETDTKDTDTEDIPF